MKPAWYTVRAAADVADVEITGVIEAETAPRLIRDIATARAVRLAIASPGGDASAGLTIAHALRGRRVEARVAVALSAATLPMAAAGHVTIAADGVTMLHGPRIVTDGSRRDWTTRREERDALDRIKAEMIDVLATRIRRSRDGIAALLDGEHWFSAAETVALGLADEIAAAPVAIAARFDPAALRSLGVIPPRFAARLGELTAPRATSKAGLNVFDVYRARNRIIGGLPWKSGPRPTARRPFASPSGYYNTTKGA
jgi:ATP-dependent protease ClpP protease subunit